MTYRSSQRGGFTLLEALMASAILSLLMAGVGVAMRATLDNYKENQKIMQASRAARSTLQRMARQLRTAKDTDFSVSNETANLTVYGQAVTLTTTVTRLIITEPQDGYGLLQVQYIHYAPTDTTPGLLYYRYQESGGTLTGANTAMLGEEPVLSVTTFDVTTVTDVETGGVVNTKVDLEILMDDKSFPFSATVGPRSMQL